MNKTYILIGIVLFLAALYIILKTCFKHETAADDHHDHHHGEDGECCGRHTVCSKGYDNSNLYFDDEELDRFRGIPCEEYSEADIDEFRTVLYTMKEGEVEEWVQCLQKRNIQLPESLREEIIFMIQ